MPLLLLYKSLWTVSDSVAMLISVDDEHARIEEYSILIWSITLEYTECQVLVTNVEQPRAGCRLLSPDVYSPKWNDLYGSIPYRMLKEII
jgi:hypothetical protein